MSSIPALMFARMKATESGIGPDHPDRDWMIDDELRRLDEDKKRELIDRSVSMLSARLKEIVRGL